MDSQFLRRFAKTNLSTQFHYLNFKFLVINFFLCHFRPPFLHDFYKSVK